MGIRLRENSFPAEGDTMLNVVLIGVSGFGDVHYRDLLRWHHAGKLNFAAAAVIDKANQREKCAEMEALGIRIYDDYRHMLAAEQADLCCIPTGIAMHAPMSIAAMRAGMNVLVEKPAAAVMSDVEAIREAEKQTGRFTAVAFQDLYRPEILHLKRLILNGMIGEITRITACASSTSGDSYYRRNNWAGKLYCDGMPIFDSPFMNGNAHQLNLAFSFAEHLLIRPSESAPFRENSTALKRSNHSIPVRSMPQRKTELIFSSFSANPRKRPFPAGSLSAEPEAEYPFRKGKSICRTAM